MDFSVKTKSSIVRSERFRTPLNAEKKIGLWVDRIGEAEDVPDSRQPRVLGLYGVVAIEAGDGFFYSRSSGELTVQAGDAVILFPDEPHLYEPAVRWKTRWIVWSGPEAFHLEQLGFIAKARSRLSGSAGMVMTAYAKLLELMNREDMASILKRKILLLELINDLFAAVKSNVTAGSMVNRLETVLEQMRHGGHYDFSVTDFAAFCGLSETHFRREFKNYTGRSPKDFMVSIRISKAKELLTQGNTIKDTAMRLGYRDVFYFMRQFKEVTGKTPGNF